MKKLKLTLLTVGFSFVLAFILSCSSNDDSEEMNIGTLSSSNIEEPSGGNSSSSSDYTSSSSIETRVCAQNNLGTGYDVINSSYINANQVKKTYIALDNTKMCQDGILSIGNSVVSEQRYETRTGETIKELYEKANIGINIGLEIPIAALFSAGMEAKFSAGATGNIINTYRYAQVRSYRYTSEDKVNTTNAQTLSKYLTDNFISDLASKSVADILDLYGTHIFIHYYKGGSLEANYVYTGANSKSISEIEAAFKANFGKNFDAGINASETSNQSEIENNMSFNYTIYGGETVGSTNMEELMANYGNWVSSISGNAVISGIAEFNQSFIAIWDLAEAVGSTKVNDLKAEFIKRGGNINFPMPNKKIENKTFPTITTAGTHKFKPNDYAEGLPATMEIYAFGGGGGGQGGHEFQCGLFACHGTGGGGGGGAAVGISATIYNNTDISVGIGSGGNGGNYTTKAKKPGVDAFGKAGGNGGDTRVTWNNGSKILIAKGGTGGSEKAWSGGNGGGTQIPSGVTPLYENNGENGESGSESDSKKVNGGGGDGASIPDQGSAGNGGEGGWADEAKNGDGAYGKPGGNGSVKIIITYPALVNLLLI